MEHIVTFYNYFDDEAHIYSTDCIYLVSVPSQDFQKYFVFFDDAVDFCAVHDFC